MEAHRTRTRWTYAEFARLPSEGGTRNEIIAGELVVTPAPGRRHQRVVTDLVTVLNAFVTDNDLGQVFAAPFDVFLGEEDYVEPDIVFVSKDRLHLLSDRGVEGTPDLVVEVVSPSTESRDRGTKLERYRHLGVREYWIVDPDPETVEVWSFAEGSEEPIVLGPQDQLHWTPMAGAQTFTVAVKGILPGES